MQTNKLTLKVIIPFIISILLIVFFALGSIYLFQNKHINEIAIEQFDDVNSALSKTIDKDIALFIGLSELIQKDETAVNLFESKDRDWLFLYLYQTYLNFNSRYNITHFYIHNLDKTNFLRIHNRDIHSDLINRYTLNKAAQTLSVSSGIEFSMNNTFTLRVVSPWFERGNLIGYIEFGEEIDNITNDLSNILNTNIILTINKNQINKNDFKKWVKENSNNNKYTMLTNHYIANSTISKIHLDKKMADLLDNNNNINNVRIENKESVYSINSKPFYDVTGKEVGKLYVLIDVTNEVTELKSTMFKILLITFLSIALIVYVYYKYIYSLNNKIKMNTEQLEFNYQFEQYINDITKNLMYGDNINECINKTLQELGQRLKAHRAYLFMFNDDYSIMNNTHEWCFDGVKSEINNLQNIATENIPWWIQQCKELKPIIIEDINSLPEEAQSEKQTLLEQHVKSLLVYPVISKNFVLGFVGIDMVNHLQKWNNTHHAFVKTTADSIANAIEKDRDEKKIIDANHNIFLALSSASNGILAIDENNLISFYNEKLLSIWGIDSIGENIDTLEKLFEVVSPLFYDYIDSLNKFNHFNSHKQQENFYLFHLKNGKTIEVVIAPSFDTGIFKGNSFSCRDITKKVSSEKELQLAAKVFENSLEGIVITDEYTNIIKVNDSFIRITGYSREELIGNKPSILQSKWHDKQFYEEIWKHLQEDSIWEGEIKDRRKDGELYVNLSTLIMIRDDEGNITNYIGINRDVTDIKMAEEHMMTLAYYDILTNLPNRTLFYDRLQQNIKYCERNGGKAALLFIDLDNFKTVNDMYGHHVGDLLLQKVAKLLTECVRESDTVSRLGGDEFTIIIRNIHSKKDIVNIADKIISQLLEPILINEIPLNIGSSIGAAIYPDDTHDVSELIRMADSAMYDAKKNGKNCLIFF